ncbi:MAG TPA: hypothetical protein VKV40_23725 [Ktedonobacteraceae bacterium]|nr:hypothetical protein [Ktedonobacteraceae bacterium]
MRRDGCLIVGTAVSIRCQRVRAAGKVAKFLGVSVFDLMEEVPDEATGEAQ